MHDSDHRKGGVGANKALEYIIALERIKDRLRRYAKNPKGVMLEPTLEDAAERIEELEAENDELRSQLGIEGRVSYP